LVEEVGLEELMGRMEREEKGGKECRRKMKEIEEWRFVKMLIREFFIIKNRVPVDGVKETISI
jgi:hypothetical protein